MVDLEGFTRSQDGERRAKTRARGYLRDVSDLDTREVGVSTLCVGHDEGVRREGGKRGARVCEELQRLVPGVGDGGGDIEIVDRLDGGGSYSPFVSSCSQTRKLKLLPDALTLSDLVAETDKAYARTMNETPIMLMMRIF